MILRMDHAVDILVYGYCKQILLARSLMVTIRAWGFLKRFEKSALGLGGSANEQNVDFVRYVELLNRVVAVQACFCLPRLMSLVVVGRHTSVLCVVCFTVSLLFFFLHAIEFWGKKP